MMATTPGFHSTQILRLSSRGKTWPHKTISNKNSKPRYAATGKSASANSGLNAPLRMENTSFSPSRTSQQTTEPRSARTSTTTSIAPTATDASSTTTRSQSTCDHYVRAATSKVWIWFKTCTNGFNVLWTKNHLGVVSTHFFRRSSEILNHCSMKYQQRSQNRIKTSNSKFSRKFR